MSPQNQHMSSSERPFRAVIVGGGPVGLCLAHTLSLAGIDHVLLERRDTVIEKSGFGLALWPHGVRILDQLGLLEEGRGMQLTMHDKYNHRADGSKVSHSSLYDSIEQKYVPLRRDEKESVPESGWRSLC